MKIINYQIEFDRYEKMLNKSQVQLGQNGIDLISNPFDLGKYEEEVSSEKLYGLPPKLDSFKNVEGELQAFIRIRSPFSQQIAFPISFENLNDILMVVNLQLNIAYSESSLSQPQLASGKTWTRYEGPFGISYYSIDQLKVLSIVYYPNVKIIDFNIITNK